MILYYKFDMLYHIYVLQFMTFLTSTCNLEFIFRELSYIFMTMFGIITYNSCYFNSKEVSIPCNFIWRGLLSPRILISASKRKCRRNNYLNNR